MKNLICLSIIVMCSIVHAELIFDPVTNQCYTFPLSSKINEAEYVGLLYQVGVIIQNIQIAHYCLNGGYIINPADCRPQVYAYLSKVGTPTALRFKSDLEKNVILYPDGSVFRQIYSA